MRRFSSSEMFAAAALLADDKELMAVATLAGLKERKWNNKNNCYPIRVPTEILQHN